MTPSEFNTKYKEYLDKGHCGLDVEIPSIIKYLDEIFEQTLTKIPGFKYQQIKIKWDCVCFYSNAGFNISRLIENKLNDLKYDHDAKEELEQENKECNSD